MWVSKKILFQAILFNQTVQIQTIQFSISLVFVYTQLNVKIVLFQTIQFTISTQFSSVWPIDRTLSGANTPAQIGPVNNGNEGVLHIPQSSSITGTSPSDSLVSYYLDIRCGEVLPLCREAVGVFYSLSRLGKFHYEFKE